MQEAKTAQEAVELMIDMQLHVVSMPERKQWKVDAYRNWKILDEKQFIAHANDKLADYHPANFGPLCPNCQNPVSKFDVNRDGVCTCSFCYHCDYEPCFNNGNIIEV